MPEDWQVDARPGGEEAFGDGVVAGEARHGSSSLNSQRSLLYIVVMEARRILLSLLLLSPVFSAPVCSAQQESFRRPRAHFSGGQPAQHKKAVLDAEKGILTCKDPGENCKIVDRIFVSPSQPLPDHGADLQEFTRKINQILMELRTGNRDSGRELSVVITPYAPFLAWCRNNAVIAKPVTQEEAPAVFYEALGIAGSVVRTQAGQGGTTRNWTFTGPGGFVCYPSRHARQLTAAFLESQRTTPAHDSVLQAATRAINDLLRQAAAGPGPKGKELSILVTPPGLMLAWSRNEGRGYAPPSEAISGESPAAAILKALTLPQQ